MSQSDAGPTARYVDAAPAHHPGPPRFTAVGSAVDLAPRAPDPDATYRWSLRAAPDDSRVSLPDHPVLSFVPDVPGRYRLACEGPDATHELTVRAFPDPTREVTLSATTREIRVAHGPDSRYDPSDPCYVCGPWNEWRVGEYRMERRGNAVEHTVSLPPGSYQYTVAPGGKLAHGVADEVEVPGPGRPRIALDATVADGTVEVVADSTAALGDDAELAVEFELDDRDALSQDAVTTDGDTLTVPVDALDAPARVHAVAVGSRHSLAATVQLDPTDDGVAVSHPGRAPDWVDDATIYEIFVRSFAGETVDTTFAEIERRLDYVDSLGVDTLWLTPVVASPTTHGYHVTDYFDTASDLGTPEEFESLVAACHDRGIRVLFDLVANHTSRDHPAFHHWSAGVDGYDDHYAPRVGDDPSDVDWAGDAPDYYFNWTRIPNLNYGSLAVRSWLLDVVDHWAPLVDGFRCDVAWGLPSGMWREVRDRARAIDGEFLMLDETVPRQADATAGFGLHHDTDCYDHLVDVGADDAPAEAVLDTFEDAAFAGFAPDATFMRYVENHDEDRYRTDHGDAAFRAAVGATFTLPGVPMIYSGQERGVEGYRDTMRWHDGDRATAEFHRRLVALRDDHPVLRDGAVEAVDHGVVDGTADRVTAYARDDGDARIVVLLHFGEGAAVVEPDESVDATDLVTGESVVASDGSGLVVDSVVVVRGAEP